MKVFNKISQLKVYLNRAIGYLGMINFLLIFATFKKAYNIQVSLYVLIPVGLLFALFFGFLDYKLIFFHENEHINKRNDLKQQLNRIEKKLNGDEK